jgi:hypothetical protein
MKAFLLSITVLVFHFYHAAAAISAESTMTIEGHLQYPDETPFNVTTRISMNHGEYTTYSRTDGNFTIHNVKPGVHIIDVHSPTHHFSQVKCRFKPDAIDEPIFGCLEYPYPGATKIPVKKHLVLTALATYEYFEMKRGFSVFGILKNPMMLMMLFSVGLMYFMPKMMEGLEPEERERVRKQMQMQQNPTQMISELFSGSASSEPEPKQRKAKK